MSGGAAPESASTAPGLRAWVLSADAPGPRVFGLSGEMRLARSLERLGVPCTVARDAPAGTGAGAAVLFRADWVYDERLVQALCEAPATLLEARDGTAVAAHAPGELLPAARRALAGEGPPEPALRRVGPDALVPAHDPALRKRAPALLEPLAADPQRLERRLFDASYKGITDLVTRYAWPPLALPAVRACARLGISPNAVTVASWLLVVVTFGCFATGRFGAGLASAWLMTFLDTVDGKLARVTLRSSRVGHVLDHGLDILHPPFWWWAFGAGLPAAPWLPAATAVAVAGYWVHRLLEGLFLALFGIEIHAWRRIDARFRLVTTRRNPNLLLLSAGWLGGRPELGFGAVAAWTVASIAFHAVRFVQAGVEAARGGAIRSEYEAPAAGAGEGP